jgi:hypothetical protein
MENIMRMVVTRHVMGLPLLDYFHGAIIIIQYFSIGIEEDLDGKVGLFVPNFQDDPPQE